MTKLKEFVETGWKLENSYTDLPEVFYSRVNPTAVSSPKLVVYNTLLGESLGLDTKAMTSDEGVAVFAGNKIPEGSQPIAQAYAGHQFGYFTMLGDGRAILLGEQITPQGERFDIQLKGSGRTPYSRRGDGRAALGPMLREYIISEAMHALGIPTSRSLAVATTGETVLRETELPGAVLTRVAASHIRVGTFEYAAQWCTTEELRTLADYAIQRHFPDAQDDENPYLALLRGAVARQASLIARWQLVGFVHGVMNTDNMAISGETIDYGPCAFMDVYDPATVFSSIDTHGRYAYGRQPVIAVWNLARFAETLLPLLDEDQDQAVELAQNAVQQFKVLYESNWQEGMRAKLGIFSEEPGDGALIKELLELMHFFSADFTNTFRSLTLNERDGIKMFESPEFSVWHEKWEARRKRQKESILASQELMRSSNPAVIPRNHRVEAALEAAVAHGDYSVMQKLVKVLSNPYAYSAEQQEYAELPEPSSCRYQTFCGT